MNALCQYAWPDNIRELQNVIERAVILSSGPSLKVAIAELHSRTIPVNEDASFRSTKRRPVRSILADVDRSQIVQALKEAGGRVGGRDGAAARLGLPTDCVHYTDEEAWYRPLRWNLFFT